METILNVVLPVFAIIFCGYLSGAFKILNETDAEAVNKFVYYFALPPLLFASTARASLHEVFNWPFIAVYLGGVGLTLVIVYLVGRFIFGKHQSELTIQMLGSVFANTAYMGIPIFLFAFGPDGTLPAVVATLAASIVILSCVVAILEGYAGTCKPGMSMLRCVVSALLKNPVIMSLTGGVFYSIGSLPLPASMNNFLDLMGNAAGPVALFSIGLSLAGRTLRMGIGELCWIVIAKLFIHPFLTWCLAWIVVDLDKQWADASVILAAMPVGAMVYVIAQQYGDYVQQSSAAIVVSTAGSVVTLSVALILFGP